MCRLTDPDGNELFLACQPIRADPPTDEPVRQNASQVTPVPHRSTEAQTGEAL